MCYRNKLATNSISCTILRRKEYINFDYITQPPGPYTNIKHEYFCTVLFTQCHHPLHKHYIETFIR